MVTSTDVPRINTIYVLVFDGAHGFVPMCKRRMQQSASQLNFAIIISEVGRLAVERPAAWNSLPKDLKNTDSHPLFCRKLEGGGTLYLVLTSKGELS